KEAARCGGLYSAHIRDEGDEIDAAVDETIEIARSSHAPAEIYHLKMAGKRNWSKLSRIIAKIEKARAQGIRITADMYTYIAAATGLDASMPAWVQEGGLEQWIARLKQPELRERALSQMRDPKPDWENVENLAGGGDGVLLLGFKSASLKPLAGQ